LVRRPQTIIVLFFATLVIFASGTLPIIAEQLSHREAEKTTFSKLEEPGSTYMAAEARIASIGLASAPNQDIVDCYRSTICTME